MSDKKFANLHYPGMKSDPNEGKVSLSELARWRFDAQIQSIGEAAQEKLMTSSALLMPASAQTVRITKKLFDLGLGRIGILGDEPLTGAHDILGEDLAVSHESTLKTFSKYAKKQMPWAQFEFFSTLSIDRQIDDIARGFTVLIVTDATYLEKALLASQALSLPMMYVRSTDKTARVLMSSVAKICHDCIDEKKESSSALFIPALDWAALHTTRLVYNLILGKTKDIILDFDAETWKVRESDLNARPACKVCSNK